MRHLKINYTLMFLFLSSCTTSNQDSSLLNQQTRCNVFWSVNPKKDSSLCLYERKFAGSYYSEAIFVHFLNCSYDTLFVPLIRACDSLYLVPPSHEICYKIDGDGAKVKWGALICNFKADSILKIPLDSSALFFINGKNNPTDSIGFRYAYLMNADSLGHKKQVTFYYANFEKKIIPN